MLKCHIAAIDEKNRQVYPHQSSAKIAGDQIRRDRRIKSPDASPALDQSEALPEIFRFMNASNSCA